MDRNEIYNVPSKKMARDEFVEEMIPYVKYIAHRIAVKLPPSVDINDLVNYGVLGLLAAMKKYDTDKSVQFKTYAGTRIRGAILDGMRAADWVPRSVRRKRREVERAYHHVEQDLGRPATYREIADHMNMSLYELRELLHSNKCASLTSLDYQTLDKAKKKIFCAYDNK